MLLLLVVVLSVAVASINCQCGSCTPHRPINGSNHLVEYVEFKGSNGYYAYPEKSMDVVEEKLFLNPFNFEDSPDGTFFAGAKNMLYEFNSTNLEMTNNHPWQPIESDKVACQTAAKDPNVACENYIRLYRKLPFTNANNRLIVCGTGAYNVTCKTLDQMNISSVIGEGPATPNLDIGIISVHPLVPFAGDFLDNPTQGYQTTGYTEVGDLNTFDFARYNTSYNPTTMEIEFVTQPSRTILTTNGFHIKAPYYPVKLIKQDFDGSDTYKMFYFFIRERKFYSQVSDAVPVRARIIRVCQQDNGVNIGANNLFFKTYLKLEMLCFGKPLNTPRAVGTQEHYYTVLRDIVQTDTPSRWNGNTNVWHKLVYGVFTGDVYGPNGTAICVYHAHFSTDSLLDNSNRGIVDVFNFNNFRDEQGTKKSGEGLLSCDKSNMDDPLDPEHEHLIAVDPIKPYFGLPLPLIEMEGETFTKILAQQVCVRLYDNSSFCRMQDVLFVGTNKGRVKKIVFSTINNDPNAELNGLTHDAIIAQEWELADDSSVEQLTMMGDNLYVGTYTRVYKFSVADCGRHLNCGDCIGSRDPYCYWDKMNGCMRHNLGTVGSETDIPFNIEGSVIFQNIHTGDDAECGLLPNCSSLTIEATAGDTIEVSGLDSCANTLSFSVTVIPYDECEGETVTVSITENNSIIQNSAILGRRLYEVTVTASGVNGDSSYSDRVLTFDGVPVVPSNSEIYSRGVNRSHVEVIISLEGCNIHDELEDHKICIKFTGSKNNETICQDYDGVNTFVSGPYQGSESINYIVTVENGHGTVTTSTPLNVTTRASAPNPPIDLETTNVGINSVTLDWLEGDQGFSTVTGYSLAVNGVKRTDCSTLNTTYTLYGLYSYTNYSFSVTACSEGGESSPIDFETLTKCDRPLPVENLYVTDSDSNYLSFEWDPPLYTNGTDLMYKVVEQCYNTSSFMTEEYTDKVETLSYTIINLQPLTRCCIEVTTVTRCSNETLQSESALACNQTLDDLPGPVEQLQGVSPNPESIFVTWYPPLNYSNPSLTYEIQWFSSDILIDSCFVLDNLYFFIEGLNASTVYTIHVNAFSSVGYGSTMIASYETLPSVPSSPDSVNIQFDNTDCKMTVGWSHDKDEDSVTQYRIRAHCNRMEYEATVDKDTMSHTFNDICNGDITALAWCTAQVQAVNEVGSSDYSSFAESVYPQSTPSTPTCYIANDLGNMVSISYTITAPYALDMLSVNYSLVPTPANHSLDTNRSFDGNNVLNFTGLSRSSVYLFRLMLCDMDNICSDPCELNFTTSQIAPAPPTTITVEITFESGFRISWETPQNEDALLLKYVIHVTGRGTSFDLTSSDNSMTVTGLLPDTDYYYVIRSIDTGANLTGPVSDSRRIITTSGEPAMPIVGGIQYMKQDGLETLSLWWNLPYPLNGTVLGFVIAWTPIETDANCQTVFDNSDRYIMNVTDPSLRFLNITNPFNSTSTTTSDRTDSSTMRDGGFICIRSDNKDESSDWVKQAFDINDLTVITQQISTDEVQDIGLLSGIVLLAIIAIVIAVILVLVLVFVIIKYKPFSNRRDCSSVDSENTTQEMTDGNYVHSNDDGRTPPKRYESTRSTTSRTVIIPKNRNHGDSEEGCCKLA